MLKSQLANTGDMWVQSLDGEDPLEEETTTRSSILAWKIPWTEGPGGLQSTGLPRVGQDLATNQSTNFIYEQTKLSDI